MKRTFAALAAIAAITTACGGGSSADTQQGTSGAQTDVEDYSELDLGETRHGANIDTTVKSFEAGVPGRQAEDKYDYYVADVELCFTKPTGESVLIGAMDFSVIDDESHAYELGADIVYPGTVTNDGPEFDQRDMSRGCNAGTITIQVPSGTALDKMVLSGGLGEPEVAEWDLTTL